MVMETEKKKSQKTSREETILEATRLK